MTRLANRSLWTLKTLLQRLGPTALVFTGIVLAGAIAFMLIENTDFLRSLYWAVVTAFTIGFGDVLPSGGPGMILVLLYIPATCLSYLVLGAHVVGVVLENRNEFTHEEQTKMFENQLEMRAELQALIEHLGIAEKVDYSEDGCK